MRAPRFFVHYNASVPERARDLLGLPDHVRQVDIAVAARLKAGALHHLHEVGRDADATALRLSEDNKVRALQAAGLCEDGAVFVYRKENGPVVRLSGDQATVVAHFEHVGGRQQLVMARPVVAPEDAVHVLGALDLPGGVNGGHFTSKLVDLMLTHADPDNLARLSQGFPSLAEAVRLYRHEPDGTARLQQIAAQY